MIQYVVCSLNSFHLKGKYFFTLHAYIYIYMYLYDHYSKINSRIQNRKGKWNGNIFKDSSIDHAWLKIHFLPNKYDPDRKVHSWDMLYTNICNWVEWANSSHFTCHQVQVSRRFTVSPQIEWIQTMRFHYSAINFLVPNKIK